MSKKMGRPTVPKDEAKSVLRGALFAPNEARTVDRAIANSGKSASAWIRNNLLLAAKRGNVSGGG